MKKKLAGLFLLCVLAFAGSAPALEIDDLIAVTAMPLAVADVIAIQEVPRTEVVTVVTTLNRAAVPAPQFIEVVRYAPMAMVERREPAFVTFVTDQYERGLVGDSLALAIADRYESYGIEDVDVVHPQVVTLVEREVLLPEVVVTRYQPVRFDPLALIAMPLAVAAVADLADVPRNDLIQFVSALNQAMVPAPQFVEVVRYSPVVFVDHTAGPQFVQFVTTEIDQGVVGRPLAFAIADRLRTIDDVDIDLVRTDSVVFVDRDVILPPVVVTRVGSAHPHGGPPGQLKKSLGLKTGAEVVHGTSPRRTVRTRSADRVVVDRPSVTKERRAKPRKIRSEGRSEKPRVVVKPQKAAPAPQMKPAKQGKSHPAAATQQGGGGKGKAKGKGKG